MISLRTKRIVQPVPQLPQVQTVQDNDLMGFKMFVLGASNFTIHIIKIVK